MLVTEIKDSVISFTLNSNRPNSFTNGPFINISCTPSYKNVKMKSSPNYRTAISLLSCFQIKKCADTYKSVQLGFTILTQYTSRYISALQSFILILENTLPYFRMCDAISCKLNFIIDERTNILADIQRTVFAFNINL